MNVVRKVFILLTGVWILAVSASFFWSYGFFTDKQEELAFQEGQSYFDLIVMARATIVCGK